MDKKDTEWELEFGNVTRTEKLELPSWEDTETEQFYVFGWWHGDVELAMRRFDADDDCEYLIVEHKSDKYKENLYGQKVKIVFKKPYNRENYIEACRLCKKLFLGVK